MWAAGSSEEPCIDSNAIRAGVARTGAGDPGGDWAVPSDVYGVRRPHEARTGSDDVPGHSEQASTQWKALQGAASDVPDLRSTTQPGRERDGQEEDRALQGWRDERGGVARPMFALVVRNQA